MWEANYELRIGVHFDKLSVRGKLRITNYELHIGVHFDKLSVGGGSGVVNLVFFKSKKQ